MSATRTRASGFTLAEVGVAALVVSIMVLVGFSGMQRWVRNRSGKDMAVKIANILMVGRAEAVSGVDPVVIFFSTDQSGGVLTDPAGEMVAALAIRDLDGDGTVDEGEHLAHVAFPQPGAISWGHSMAAAGALGDPAGAAGHPPTASMTFDRPDGAEANWIAFLPDGTPRAYVDESVSGIGAVGTGAGAIYLTSGSRDYAVVLSPLGTAHVQTWDDDAERWKR